MSAPDESPRPGSPPPGKEKPKSVGETIGQIFIIFLVVAALIFGTCLLALS